MKGRFVYSCRTMKENLGNVGEKYVILTCVYLYHTFMLELACVCNSEFSAMCVLCDKFII